MTGVAWWSQIAASNATQDPTINWSEGQAPSSVNDSARAEMASVAKWRDDISGAIVTGGTSTAYTVASNQSFDTLVRLSNQLIAFTPHASSGGTCTLNVDGLGAKPLRSAPSTELPAGTLILGTPYIAIYNNTDGAFYLQGFYGSAYNIPLGAGLDYWLSTAPNSSFAFPIGQAISRTTYATLFAQMGTTYGSGDGSTTFNLPDKRGRVSAGFDNGNATGRLNTGGMNAASLGSAGGEQTHTLTAAELAAHTHSSSIIDPGHSHSYTRLNGALRNDGTSALTVNTAQVGDTTGSNVTGITINNASAGGGGAHNNIQPTIVSNYILRVI